MNSYEVRIFSIPERVPAEAWSRWGTVPSADRQERIQRARVERLRSELLISDLATRVALGRALGVSPRSLRFSQGEHGKPTLEGTPLHFNVSHSGAWGVLAWGPEPLGVDVEEPRAIDEGVAERFFAPAERDWVKGGATEAERKARFFKVWVLKEAYVKADGRGIGLGLESFSVAGCAAGQEAPFAVNGWEFRLFEAAPGIPLGLALKPGSGLVRVQFQSFAEIEAGLL